MSEGRENSDSALSSVCEDGSIILNKNGQPVKVTLVKKKKKKKKVRKNTLSDSPILEDCPTSGNSQTTDTLQPIFDLSPTTFLPLGMRPSTTTLYDTSAQFVDQQGKMQTKPKRIRQHKSPAPSSSAPPSSLPPSSVPPSSVPPLSVLPTPSSSSVSPCFLPPSPSSVLPPSPSSVLPPSPSTALPIVPSSVLPPTQSSELPPAQSSVLPPAPSSPHSAPSSPSTSARQLAPLPPPPPPSQSILPSQSPLAHPEDTVRRSSCPVRAVPSVTCNDTVICTRTTTHVSDKDIIRKARRKHLEKRGIDNLTCKERLELLGMRHQKDEWTSGIAFPQTECDMSASGLDSTSTFTPCSFVHRQSLACPDVGQALGSYTCSPPRFQENSLEQPSVPSFTGSYSPTGFESRSAVSTTSAAPAEVPRHVQIGSLDVNRERIRVRAPRGSQDEPQCAGSLAQNSSQFGRQSKGGGPSNSSQNNAEDDDDSFASLAADEDLSVTMSSTPTSDHNRSPSTDREDPSVPPAILLACPSRTSRSNDSEATDTSGLHCRGRSSHRGSAGGFIETGGLGGNLFVPSSLTVYSVHNVDASKQSSQHTKLKPKEDAAAQRDRAPCAATAANDQDLAIEFFNPYAFTGCNNQEMNDSPSGNKTLLAECSLYRLSETTIYGLDTKVEDNCPPEEKDEKVAPEKSFQEYDPTGSQPSACTHSSNSLEGREMAIFRKSLAPACSNDELDEMDRAQVNQIGMFQQQLPPRLCPTGHIQSTKSSSSGYSALLEEDSQVSEEPQGSGIWGQLENITNPQTQSLNVDNKSEQAEKTQAAPSSSQGGKLPASQMSSVPSDVTAEIIDGMIEHLQNSRHSVRQNQELFNAILGPPLLEQQSALASAARNLRIAMRLPVPEESKCVSRGCKRILQRYCKHCIAFLCNKCAQKGCIGQPSHDIIDFHEMFDIEKHRYTEWRELAEQNLTSLYEKMLQKDTLRKELEFLSRGGRASDTKNSQQTMLPSMLNMLDHVNHDIEELRRKFSLTSLQKIDFFVGQTLEYNRPTDEENEFDSEK